MKKGFVFLILISLLASCRWTNDAADTAFNEFSASAMLKKYEYYKDASAMLDKKLADMKVYEVRLNDLKQAYEGKSRAEWARDDREQYSIWTSEISGIKSSYNSLAAEYNSAMSKFNYAFCNVGQLPKGASTPLPREFKPYVEQ